MSNSNYHCSIYVIGSHLRPHGRGERRRKSIDPIERLNAIARWWKKWTGENAIFTWHGYRSQVKAIVDSKAAELLREYE